MPKKYLSKVNNTECLIRAIVVLVSALFYSTAAQANSRDAVKQWDIYEVALNGPTNGNPFVDVQICAEFDNGSKKVQVPGFYDGDGVYRIRFMPDTQGRWHYETHANVWSLAGKVGEFTVAPSGKNNHGPVRIHSTFHFAYSDGTPYVSIGSTIYCWLDASQSVQEETLKTLKGSLFNKVRMLVTQQPSSYQRKFAPPLWPFARKPPSDWDLTRFNPEFFRHYEKGISQLRDLGIQADVILFNPYGKWGFERMDAAGDERYVRYVVARFSAYHNVRWSLCNENSFLRAKPESAWDRIGELVQECDPYQHLRSIHNGPKPYNYSKPWVTHVSFQSRTAMETPGSASMLRLAYQKPVIYDEIGYEGNNRARWGQLSAEEMAHRFWCGMIACTFVTHGDCYNSDGASSWIGFGGTIHGHSVPRIAFLKQILEDGPQEGLDAIDQDFEPNVAGQTGTYYLKYFGKDQPTNWAFQLYKRGVVDGMKFKVDVIDTWNMTITPVEGEFVTKKIDGYYFIDAHGRSVSLPGRSGIALRIRYTGGKSTESAEALDDED